jgi:cytoskeletal protein RodZ
MSELGRLLAEARSAKELTLADVETATRIRQKYLQALENGEYARLPRGATARGLLRVYAGYLGLDVTDMLRRYVQESGDTSEEVAMAEPGKPRLVDYRPIEVALVDSQPRTGWWRWAIAIVVVLALAAAAWWFLGGDLDINPLAAFGPAPVVWPTPSATATRWVVTATPPPAPTATAPQPTPTSDLLPLPIPTMSPTVTPTPRPTATPETVGRIALTLRITQRAWVRVIADGAVAIEDNLEAGQTHTWEASKSISVRTGNAGGVNLVLNGADLGLMGKIGEVVERAWVADQGQVAESSPTTPTPTRRPTATSTPAG